MKKSDKGEEFREKAKKWHEKLHFIKRNDRIIRRVVFHYYVMNKKWKFVLLIFFLIGLSELIFFIFLFLFLFYLGKRNKKIKGWPPKGTSIIEKIEYLYGEVPLYLVILHYLTVWLAFFFFVFFM